jgi:hypothetical protein
LGLRQGAAEWGCEMGQFILSMRFASLRKGLLPKIRGFSILFFLSPHLCLSLVVYAFFAFLFQYIFLLCGLKKNHVTEIQNMLLFFGPIAWLQTIVYSILVQMSPKNFDRRKAMRIIAFFFHPKNIQRSSKERQVSLRGRYLKCLTKKTRLTAGAIFSDIMLANLINKDDILIVTFIWTIQWLNITCICCLGSSTIQVKTLLHSTVLFLIGGATIINTDFSPATIVCEQGKFRKKSWLTRSTGCAVF